MKSKPIMILGCTSDAGKSLIVTAICRYLANKGVSVAPFKAQNMSNNAAVTSEGLEIGRAQYLQAIAAKVTPSVLMNPILLKPSADTFSQVIVNGKVDNAIAALPWGARKSSLWPHVQSALKTLQSQYEQIIIEGAGSPAEINLREGDIVNMSVALECDADVYIVSDIDRGGSFAHLLGTFLCLSDIEKQRVKGFVLNKFRGDEALLGNALDWLEEKTGVPTVATLPYYRHQLPEEDAFRLGEKWQSGKINVALIYYPYASNLDEFDPLLQHLELNLVPITKECDLTPYDAVILPGSKNIGASLSFLRETGLDEKIALFKESKKAIVAICGGLQISGTTIYDPLFLEEGDKVGLNLINLSTALLQDKKTQQTEFLWQGELIKGYEIHHGTSISAEHVEPFLKEGLGWSFENVYCTYLHGTFENKAFYNWFMRKIGALETGVDWHDHLEVELDDLASMFEKYSWL